MTENPIDKLYAAFQKSGIVTTDSRNIPEGALFFALKGENFDGNTFARQALEKGAILAVVDDPALKNEDRMLWVNDSLLALQQLASRYRQHLKATIIGITGSNGKTTTKELISTVLGSANSVKATKGNLNNHIGVPLTLLSFPADLEFGIVEMGANHQGEIKSLCEIANPDYGIITNIGKAHLEGFGGFEGVLKAKSELYRHMQKHQRPVFVNANNDLLMKASEANDRIFYGREQDAVWGQVSSQEPFLNVQCSVDGDSLGIRTKLVGTYNLENVLAALSIGHHFNLDVAQMAGAIETYVPDNNRSQVSVTRANTLILDAYNANPSSMEAAITNFSSASHNDKMLILGEMLELGEDAHKEHARIIHLVKKAGITDVLLVGPNFQSFKDSGYPVFAETKDLLAYVRENPIRGKTILIKGSRGNKLEQLTAWL